MMRPPPHFVIVGNYGDQRISLFQAALARAGLHPASVIPYLDLISGHIRLEHLIRDGSILRIESPGRNFEVERGILALGAEVDDGEISARIPLAQARSLTFDKGRIWSPRQWFLGFRKLLRLIEQQRAECPPHFTTSPVQAIEIMFDKVACHARLTHAGVSCPAGLGPVRSYDELRRRMLETGIGRVFVKLAHGSSASGVVAFAADGRRQMAMTTVETVRQGGELRLYNTRRILRVNDDREVAELINALAREQVHVEQWVPKAGIDGQVFDLRVVVIAGRAQHIVVRKSRSPMTNLHLLNQRGDADRVQARMSPTAWANAMATCEHSASTFPGYLHAGVDLMFAPGYRRHAVLEVNAFGDLLLGVTHHGLDTYSAEVAAILTREAA